MPSVRANAASFFKFSFSNTALSRRLESVAENKIVNAKTGPFLLCHSGLRLGQLERDERLTVHEITGCAGLRADGYCWKNGRYRNDYN